MFDFNAILNQVLATAIAQATAPLIRRIEELEAKQAQPTPSLDINAAMDALNQQEWFWEKIRSYIDAGIEVGLEDHTGTYDHDDFVLRGDLSELIKDTVGDFDDFIRKDDMPDPDDLVTKDELPDNIPDADDLVTVDNINDHIEEYLTRVRITRA